MDYDDNSLNSIPTVAGGARPLRADIDKSHSFGSGTTEVGPITPSRGHLRVGEKLLGRYTVLDKLGEGGMGVVYKCLDTVGCIEVAIKCLPPELSRNESEMEGIRENYAIVARLHHSAISGLRQLEKDPDSGEYYLVMDLAKGEDLSKILHRRHGAPMPLDEALAILQPLASALDYAHAEKVLHRDVKPGNVKVDGNRVQLLDFGLAAEVRSSMSRVSLRGHAGSSGTPAYMAPEQWEARRQSAATDQYSLAVMAYQMLSGYLPFDADDMALLKDAVLTRPPEEIEGVPAHVNAALMRALAKNPKERYGCCAEFVEAISNAETQGTQRNSHTEAQRHRENISDTAKPDDSTSAISEADVLRRKLALTKAVKAIPAEDRADNEFAKFVGQAEDELAVADEACKIGRFAAATESLTAAESALNDLMKAKQAREEAERRAREEAERKAKEDAERKTREEAERKAKEEAERKAKEEAERKARAWIGDKAGERKIIHVGSQEIALRWCPPGMFTMGSPVSEKGRENDEMQHHVTLTKGFWMDETEVTQGLWWEVMGNNPSYNKSGYTYPVERVSWEDCQKFLKKLNIRFPQSGLCWALPTEAQWEYACRADSTGAYGGTGHLNDMGWYDRNSGGTTHPVKHKQPNAWGLYDMHGNVWEWCQDWHGDYPFGDVTDPSGSASGSYRVCRGGSWGCIARLCRSAYRNGNNPSYRDSQGFRVALVPVN